jgi:hypothetical protein
MKTDKEILDDAGLRLYGAINAQTEQTTSGCYILDIDSDDEVFVRGKAIPALIRELQRMLR